MIAIQGKRQLAEYLKISYTSVDTNFPKIAAAQLAKGIEITREGQGENTIYYLQEVEPKKVSKKVFSSQSKEKAISLDNEVWKTIPEFPSHQISNLGRIKNKAGYLIKGYKNAGGYILTELADGQKRMVHRLVLSTFSPIENAEDFTVDHLNGIRTDNRLENLRWCSMEDNVAFMLLKRSDLNKELTRIIQKYGYDTTLDLLKQI